jgi:hypothetical protein
MSTDRPDTAPIRFMTLHELRREGAGPRPDGPRARSRQPRLVLRTLRT